MDTPHTSGPWKIEERYTFHKFGHEWKIVRMDRIPDDDRWVAVVCIDSMHGLVGPNTSTDQQLANARLIAAAPDLLEALKYVRTHRPNSVGQNMAAAAIAKAEGRS